MIFNSGTYYRSIASQNILSYSIEGNIDSTNGILSFGFSGDNTNLNLFRFETGKIFDINNRHVWSYNPSENFKISGNINTGDLNYYINDNIICLSTPKSNNYYKYFYINSSNNTADLNINIYGNKQPEYLIKFPFTNLIGENITGYIINNANINNFSFQFFSGEMFSQEFYSVKNIFNNFISGSKSGEIILNYTSSVDPGNFYSGIQSSFNSLDGYILFNTNFGTFSYNLGVPVQPKQYYYIDLVELFTGIIDDLNYQYNYNLQTKSSNDQTVNISLINYEGHDNSLYYTGFTMTGLVNGSVSGFIHGSDYITGVISGTGTTLITDYYGNYLQGALINNIKQLQYATGLINYYYNLPIEGGSGLAPAPPNTLVQASGSLFNLILDNNFIYGSGQISSGKSGVLTGYWYNFQQTGSGVITINNLKYFTGDSVIDYKNLSWNGIPNIGFDIENYNNNYKVYGVTGSGIISFSNFNSGTRSLNQNIYTNQNTGILSKKLFNLESTQITNISGDIFGSENVENLVYVFGSDSLFQWGTAPEISTGYLGFEFKNFSPQDSGIINYYEIDLNKNFSNYKFLPINFKLQGSNNFSSWSDMDTRSNVNFYEPFTNVFQVTGTGNYHYVRLLITGNQSYLQHINQNLLNDYEYGLSINKINFYSSITGISGLYRNFIDNDVTGNYFYSSFNTGLGPDYFYSDDEGNNDLYYVSKLDKSLYPEVFLTGERLVYATSQAYTGYNITGFYVNFNPNFLPTGLSIEASADGSTWSFLAYKKFGNINSIESGFLPTGIVINATTPWKYFALNLKAGYGEETSTCTTGWKAARYPNLNISEATDIFIRDDAVRSLIISKMYTGNGPYTGIIFQNTAGYNGSWSLRLQFTGVTGAIYPEQVQLKSLASSKSNGQYVLISRDGNIFNSGSFPDVGSYKIALNSNFGFASATNFWRETGFNGSWTDVAMSRNGNIMAAVGNYDYDFNISAQVSINTGVTWTNIGDLNGSNYSCVTMSSGGNVMYCFNTDTYDILKSINTGTNWSSIYTHSNYINDICTDNNGKYITFCSSNGIYTSEDSGNNWTQRDTTDSIKVAMSNDAQYQLVIYNNSNGVVRSDNTGINWTTVTGLNGLPSTAAAINTGNIQYVVGNNMRLHNNCTRGYDLPPLDQTVGVKKFNLYTKITSGFFNTFLPTITGYGYNNLSISGVGTGFLLNPTGFVYQPAIFYQTGLLTGLIDTNNGSYTWESVSIGGTGNTDKVFSYYTTGFVNASGIIYFNTGLLSEGDKIYINNVEFVYQTGAPESYYAFNNLNYLINVLNSGATGALDYYLQYSVGVTGYVLPLNSGIVLYAYYNLGETGNNNKLTRDATNLDAIKIPNRYFQGGQSLRYKIKDGEWNGNFSGNFYNLNYENSGIYVLNYEQEEYQDIITGVIFENNFYPNWSAKVTPISEGILLNTGLTANLNYTSGWMKYISYSAGYSKFNKKDGTVFVHSDNVQQGNVDIFTLNKNYNINIPDPISTFTPTTIGGYNIGRSIDIDYSGNIIVIGGYNFNSQTGFAAVITGNSKDGWIFTQKIEPSPPHVSYGKTVAIDYSGKHIAIGAPDENYGRVSIYQNSAPGLFSFVQTISGDPMTQPSNCQFGNSICFNFGGNILAVGAPVGVGGYVSIFKKIGSTWYNTQTISPPYQYGTYFGANLSISKNFTDSNVLVISDPLVSSSLGRLSGVISVYTGSYNSNFILNKTFSGAVAIGGYQFVDVNSNGTIIVRGNSKDLVSPNSNFIYIYTGNPYSTWDLQNTILSNPVTNDININDNNAILSSASNSSTDIYYLKDILSGQFTIKSGLGYLGYSGLNIEFDKQSFDILNNTGNFVKYQIDVDNNKFLFTGLLKG